MKNLVTSLLAIILGIIIIAFPLVGVVAVGVIAGFAVLILAIWFLLAGIMEMESSKTVGILYVILGLIALMFAFGLIFNPALVSFISGLVLYLAGILMIIAGVISLLGGMDQKYRVWGGVLGIILGIIYIILGTYAFSPIYLGMLIGIWLVITGILGLVGKD